LDTKDKERYNIVQPLLLAAMMAIGIMIGVKINETKTYPLIEKIDYNNGAQYTGRVEELLRFIENKYVDDIKTEELLDEALSALINKLDPHSTYLSPAELEDVNDQMNGNFRGVGIETMMVDDTVVIYRVLENSPAKKAGFKPFDQLISIDGLQVAGQNLKFAEIRKNLRKSLGAELEIELKRKNQILNKTLTVNDIPVNTISAAYKLHDSIGFIKVDRFANNTYREFMEKVEDLFSDTKCKHLIIDLRGNPGGYLPEATNILCQIFEEKNLLLVYTEGKNSKKSEYKTTGKRFFNIQKVVVLIDENSASASEIIAGSIQDWDRGVVIGRRSYGKGLVQEQYDLNNGGAIRLTVARYYTPSGRSLQRNYRDREVYDNDLNTRYDNGHLFQIDTLHSSDVLDTATFYTMRLNRKVKGGGGVSPDIFVPLDSIYLNESYLKIESKLSEFVVTRGIDFSLQSYNNYDQISGFKGSDEFYSKFAKYAKLDVNDKILKNHRSHLDKSIKYLLAMMNMDESTSIRIDNNSDKVFNEALDYILKNKTLQ